MSEILMEILLAYAYAVIGMFLLYLITEVAEARQDIDVTVYEFLILIIKSWFFALVWPISACAIVVKDFPDLVLFKKVKPKELTK